MAATIVGASINISATSTTYGTAGTSKSLSVSGTEITGGILVTPPTGFEVSLDNVTFGATQTVTGTGTIATTTVHVRLKAAQAVGSYSGNIALTSTGATAVNVPIPASTITKAPVVITAENKTKNYGSANPALTFVATGLKNSETSSVFTTQPTLSTTAVTGSPAGSYPIVPSGAVATNYSFTYVNGSLVVSVPKPAIADLIANPDKDMQFVILKAHGVKTQTDNQNYLYQDYSFDYTVSAVTAKFVVKTRLGKATVVLVDTTQV